MAKKKLYLIIIAIISLTLLGLYFYYYFNNKKILPTEQSPIISPKNEQAEKTNLSTESQNILLEKTIESKNLTDCLKLEQTMLQRTCIEKIAEENNNTDCSLIVNQDLQDGCSSVIYYQQAKIKNDSKICYQINKLIVRANCLSEIEKIDLHSDLDNDDLDFLQEITNNTNPNNPDTDGDGFKDGQEIASGFNPDGKGSLNPVTPFNLIPCKEIKDEQIQLICLFELKDKPLDLFACQNLKEERLKNFCFNTLYPN